MENPTGLFFAEQSESALIKAIQDFEAMETEFCPQTIRQHALQFDREIFKQKIAEFVRSAMAEFLEHGRPESAFGRGGTL